MADFLKSVNRDLGSFLGNAVPTFAKVYDEFPEPNQEMELPALSIVTGRPRFERCDPYLVDEGAVADHQATNNYVIGQYDLSLQLDIWAKYKIQRSSLYEEVFQALNPVNQKGLQITLSDYFSEVCSYQLVSYAFSNDQEAAITRQEWRVRLEVEASCRAVAQSTDYVITQEPVLTFTTPNVIEDE